MFLVIAALLVLGACADPATAVVVRVDDATMTRQALDAQIALLEAGFAAQADSGVTPPDRATLEKDIVERFIDQHIVLAVARTRGIEVSDADVETQLAQFREQIPEMTGGTLDEAVKNQLGLPGESSSEFRQFVLFIVAQQKLAESLVSDAELRASITDEVMAQTTEMVQRADVAHILVATEDEARTVLARLDAGEEFGALAAELSTDPGSAQNGGLYEGIAPGEFVPEFDEYMFGKLKPGETTSDPVQTQFGYHIIKLVALNEGPVVDPAQAEMMIEQRVQESLQMQRDSAFQQLILEERTRAEQENRIVRPVYPTATPAPIEDGVVPTPVP